MITDNEIWATIPGFDGYKVSNMGRVKSMKNGVILRPGTLRSGYLFVSLYKNNVSKTLTIHRLVAKAFIPNPENKPEVNHKKGDKTDNRASELEWNTTRENRDHAKLHKLTPKPHEQRGEFNSQHKLSHNQVMDIISKYSSGNYSQCVLAKEYGVSKATICNIVNGESWCIINEVERVKPMRSGDRILVLDTSNGIFYNSIRQAAISKNIPITTLVSALKSNKKNNTTFIKA